MTKPTLAQLRAIAEAATPGPWRLDGSDIVQLTDGGNGYPLDYYTDSVDIATGKCAECGSYDSGIQKQKDAAHIAAFNPAQCLALLDEIERLRALLARRSAVLGVIECKRAGCLASIDLPIIANSAWHVDDEGRWICPAHTKELSHAD